MKYSFSYPVNSSNVLRGELDIQYMITEEDELQIISVRWDNSELLALFEADQMGYPYYQLVLAAENNYNTLKQSKCILSQA